jgi:hypothetical protein
VDIVSSLTDSIDGSEASWVPPLRQQSDSPLQVVDRLMVELFLLRKLFSARHYSGGNAGILDDIDLRVSSLWDEYGEEASRRGEFLQAQTMSGTTFRDGPTAVTLSFFATARIILLLAGHPGNPNSSHTFDGHCQMILDCALYVYDSRFVIGCASLPMILPLALVARYGTLPQHRAVASMFLKDRENVVGFAGLRFIAVRCFDSIQTEGSIILAEV